MDSEYGTPFRRARAQNCTVRSLNGYQDEVHDGVVFGVSHGLPPESAFPYRCVARYGMRKACPTPIVIRLLGDEGPESEASRLPQNSSVTPAGSAMDAVVRARIWKRLPSLLVRISIGLRDGLKASNKLCTSLVNDAEFREACYLLRTLQRD